MEALGADMSKCIVRGCMKPQGRGKGYTCGGLCFAHHQRKKRGQDMEKPIEPRFQIPDPLEFLHVMDAFVDLLNSDDNDEQGFKHRLAKTKAICLAWAKLQVP